MRYHALAADYDGTLAVQGRIDERTLVSLRRLRAPAPDRWFLVAMLGSIVLIFIDGATLDYRFYSYVPMLAWLSLALLRRCLAGPVPA